MDWRKDHQVDAEQSTIKSNRAYYEDYIAFLYSQVKDVRDLGVLVPFLYGNLGTTYVKFRDLLWMEDLENPGGNDMVAPDVDAQRVGTAEVRFEQVI